MKYSQGVNIDNDGLEPVVIYEVLYGDNHHQNTSGHIQNNEEDINGRHDVGGVDRRTKQLKNKGRGAVKAVDSFEVRLLQIPSPGARKRLFRPFRFLLSRLSIHHLSRHGVYTCMIVLFMLDVQCSLLFVIVS
jgi:hypothetical protein